MIYDDLSAGHREAALGAPLIEGDIADVDAVRRAIRDAVRPPSMHFAAWLMVPDSVRDPPGYYRNNVIGTLGTLEAMAAERCQRFVFSSTCAVYGEPVETPIQRGPSHRTDQCLRPDQADDRARAAALRTRVRRFVRSGCATSTLRAPTLTANSARITRQRSMSFPERSKRPPVVRR